jgi:hypothetical protein
VHGHLHAIHGMACAPVCQALLALISTSSASPALFGQVSSLAPACRSGSGLCATMRHPVTFFQPRLPTPCYPQLTCHKLLVTLLIPLGIDPARVMIQLQAFPNL